MVHGYHVVFGTYGFWLPNDLRGSWSHIVAAGALRRQGPSTRYMERTSLTSAQQEWQAETKQKLLFPEVVLNGKQALAVATGFTNAIGKSQLVIWACSILPQHVHLVVARHRIQIEFIVGLLKGEATKELKRSNLHPLADYRNRKGETPTPWNVKSYRGYLETEGEIDDAIDYVNDNPCKEGKRRQRWGFVTPFRGLDPGLVSYG